MDFKKYTHIYTYYISKNLSYRAGMPQQNHYIIMHVFVNQTSLSFLKRKTEQDQFKEKLNKVMEMH